MNQSLTTFLSCVLILMTRVGFFGYLTLMFDEAVGCRILDFGLAGSISALSSLSCFDGLISVE
jgi:hypothetical protein